MRSDSKLVSVRLNFGANDLEFAEALLRPRGEDPADVRLIIEHRFLGSFALHDDFVLEVRGIGVPPTWRRVNLEELKLAFLEASRNDGGVTEKEWDCWEVSGVDVGGNHTNLLRMAVEGDSSHIVRAREAFLRGGIRYKIVGGVGSRGQIWGHATFLVNSLRRARALLCDGGFISSSDSPQVLIDSKNGWKIRLLEEPQRKLRA
jgi:hypothetical protein